MPYGKTDTIVSDGSLLVLLGENKKMDTIASIPTPYGDVYGNNILLVCVYRKETEKYVVAQIVEHSTVQPYGIVFSDRTEALNEFGRQASAMWRTLS